MEEKKKESKFKKSVEGVGKWIKKNGLVIMWSGISCIAVYDVYKLGQLSGIKNFIQNGDAELVNIADETQGNLIGIRSSYGIFSGLKCFSKEYTKEVVIPMFENLKEE